MQVTEEMEISNHVEGVQENVLQEVWIRVFLKIHTLHAPQAFRVWLYKIAHDVAISQLRKSKRHEMASWNEETSDQLPDESLRSLPPRCAPTMS
jgi:DNA-directed RNA polymerase specialized sigma24 family protein